MSFLHPVLPFVLPCFLQAFLFFHHPAFPLFVDPSDVEVGPMDVGLQSAQSVGVVVQGAFATCSQVLEAHLIDKDGCLPTRVVAVDDKTVVRLIPKSAEPLMSFISTRRFSPFRLARFTLRGWATRMNSTRCWAAKRTMRFRRSLMSCSSVMADSFSSVSKRFSGSMTTMRTPPPHAPWWLAQ